MTDLTVASRVGLTEYTCVQEGERSALTACEASNGHSFALCKVTIGTSTLREVTPTDIIERVGPS